VVRAATSLVSCEVFVSNCLPFYPFSLAIELSALLRFTSSDYLFGIFKRFLVEGTAIFKIDKISSQANNEKGITIIMKQY